MNNEENTQVFNITLEEYTRKMINALKGRLSNFNMSEQLILILNPDSQRITGVKLNVTNGYFKTDPQEKFKIRLQETLKDQKGYITTKKYTYEIANQTDSSDFIRFDFKPSNDYPNHHINVDEEIWGKRHFVFPDDTNIKLYNMNAHKAILSFQIYQKSSASHLLNQDENEEYLKVINTDSF